MSKTYKYILDFVGSNRQFIQTIDQNERKLKEMDGSVGSSKSKMNGFFGDMSKQVLALGSFAALTAGAKMLVSNVIDVRSEFEKYEAVLTTALGSQRKAAESMSMLQDFAKSTPYQLSELTGAYVKLTNYGLKPNIEEMRKYGDLASSVGKGFDQLTEGIADAVTGEYERLKEFGIKASVEGNRVTFTFKEQKTVVDNNAQSIKKYILSLGELAGVQGSMSSISQTLGGRISNLSDAWDGLMNSMGSKSSGVMSNVINFLTEATNRANSFIKGPGSAQEQKNSIISDWLTGLPKDEKLAKQKISEYMSNIKDWINSTTDKLNAESGRFDINSVIFRKEHADKIAQLTQNLEIYQLLLKELPSEYQKEVDAAKASEEQKKKDAEAANLKKSSISGLEDSLKTLKESEDKINASNKDAIALHYAQVAAIEYRIAENEKLKKSVAELYADEQSGIRTMKLPMLISKQSDLFGYQDSKSKNVVDLYKEFQAIAGTPIDTKAKLDLSGIQEQMPLFQKNMGFVRKELDLTKQKQEAVASAFQSGFESIGNSIVSGLGLAKDGFEGFVSGLADTAIKLISIMLSQSLANSIAGATASGTATGPAAIFSTPAFIATAIAGVMGAFAAIPAFADGGIVYGPTMGLMGEYPGARSNPEVIAPLSKLQAMISRSGNDRPIILQPSVDFTGDKMRVMLNMVENKRLKRVGK